MTMPQASRDRRGFSLIEVMISLIVLSLIMGSAVALLRSQTRAFALGGAKADMFQNGRYVVTTVERMVRTLGAGVAGAQPMIVYGNNDVMAFNADYAETDTTSMRWAVYFNPDQDTLAAVAWDSANAGVIPNSSYTYPTQNYRLANGATGSAETIVLYFSLDASTARTDDYTLNLRFNDRTAEVVARNILADPARPFIEYHMVSGGNLVQATGTNLPLIRKALTPVMTTAESLSAQRPDSVRAIRLSYRITNGQTGAAQKLLSMSTMIQVPNNGLPQPIVCGRTPLGPNTFNVAPDTVPGSGIVNLTWTRSPDHGGGEQDIQQYLLYSRHLEIPAPDWDLVTYVRADTGSTWTFPAGGYTPDSTYEFAVAAQDCTPFISSMSVANAVAP
jgi:prepilin-type N-terminal cleavage/methylation domain-containing protein